MGTYDEIDEETWTELIAECKTKHENELEALIKDNVGKAEHEMEELINACIDAQKKEMDALVEERKRVLAGDKYPGRPVRDGTPEDQHPDAVFRPKLYIFELYNYNKLKMMLYTNTLPDNLEIRCPEFAILLDHAIAMLWLFYNDNKNWHHFSVPQIEWAYKFIGGIASEQGDTYTDMETIKQHLEKLLFDTYSETDVSVLEDLPPIEDLGLFGPISCPERTRTCTPIPESIKELLNRAPDMVEHLSLAQGDNECGLQVEDREIKRANMMKSAYMKLNNFERKHLGRITEEIELFEMIKALKQELGYNNENIDPIEITNLRLKMEELEHKLIDQMDQH